jgi:hypothetical protein
VQFAKHALKPLFSHTALQLCHPGAFFAAMPGFVLSARAYSCHPALRLVTPRFFLSSRASFCHAGPLLVISGADPGSQRSTALEQGQLHKRLAAAQRANSKRQHPINQISTPN